MNTFRSDGDSTNATGFGTGSGAFTVIGNLSTASNWNIVAPASGVAITASMATSSRQPGKIGLSLYFRFVKSKFSTLEKKKIADAVRKYNALRFEANLVGQRGLYEHLSDLLLVVVREQQLIACGFNHAIKRVDVDKFMHRVDGPVKLDPIANFPRVIPELPKMRLKRAQERGLFDEYYVLYMPAPAESSLKSAAQKIREKDPILFGVFSHAPDKLYVVADWVDEYCDITVERLVRDTRKVDPEYLPQILRVPTESDIEDLRAEVLTRHQRVLTTRPTNYKELEAQEIADRRKKPSLATRMWKKIKNAWTVDLA